MVNIIIQNRDVEVLRSLAETGALNIDQISKLHFKGKKDAAIKRIQKLHRANLIAKQAQLPGGFVLSKGSRSAMSNQGIFVKRAPNQYQWKHHLMTMDVKVALETQYEELSLEVDCSPRSINRFGNAIKPDLVVHFESDDLKYQSFIETDRATESNMMIVEKVRAYSRLLYTNPFARNTNCNQVWFVVENEARRRFLAALFSTLPRSMTQNVVTVSLREVTEAIWEPLEKQTLRRRLPRNLPR